MDHAPAPPPGLGWVPSATFLCPVHALVSDLVCMESPLLQGIFCPSPAMPLWTPVSVKLEGAPHGIPHALCPGPLPTGPARAHPYLWDTEQCWPHPTRTPFSDSRSPPLEPGGVHRHLVPWEDGEAARGGRMWGLEGRGGAGWGAGSRWLAGKQERRGWGWRRIRPGA